MPVPQLDLSLYRGDSFTHRLIWQDSTGTPIDLTGYSAKMDVVPAKGSPTTLLALTSPLGIVLGGVAGTIDIVVSSAQAKIDVVSSVYDLEMTSPSPTSAVTTLVQGAFTVTPDATRTP